MGALESCAGYLYLCIWCTPLRRVWEVQVVRLSLGGSSSLSLERLSLILASARVVFPFLDVEMSWNFLELEVWNVDLGRFEQLYSTRHGLFLQITI
jgi:hypothetical protein